MTGAVQEEVSTPDNSVLNMSDEDWVNQGLGNSPAEPVTPADPVVEDPASEEETEDEDTDEQGENTEPTEPAAEETEDTDEGDPAADDGGDDKAKDPEPVEDTEPDYKALYEQLTAPFKANGKEMRIDNIDDAIQLMKMGAGFNKKMAALKPNIKIMKLLENNNLLDEDKLSFLIDIDKRNPEAIAKLLKDSKIDPMDVDTDKADAYKATRYSVDDRELELDTVLEAIRDSDTYTQTLDIVSTKWDAKSKETVLETPQILTVINDHVATGVYDVITQEMEKERVLGRLNGLSDIEAYRQVGDAIQARKGFDHLFQGQQSPPPAPDKTPKPKTADTARKDQRRAVSSPKPSAPAKPTEEFNPLAMSDEEFSKVGLPKFI